ncbi:hypothetical protein RIF25_07690 [Thermosynechococcaceae cyanobacterium BACA0444]|uniref:Methyl-accepting transducer domain-containing protein n=1 Tax=Pseudocalidococcus azoricus BACA0444 TaxID=2918990 RepID=A0AAE4FS09_9CYAN|nr:hypothetical protein [Pseudocalidococcus azoricus]MDS3860693.1 hypothetical protein [Pseudocalidococcus azoricus BACA0444]
MAQLQELTSQTNQPLTPQSPLHLLPTYSSCFTSDVIGQSILEQFQAQPELPGVIILADNKPKALIPQAKFYARLNQPFGRELYLKRPIQLLLEGSALEALPLVLPASCPIITAVRAALSRESEFVYDPIILAGAGAGDYLLLSCHTLLLAQTKILQQIHRFMAQQEDEKQALTQALITAQAKAESYAQQLAQSQIDSHRHQEILEHQNQELRAQAKQISRINQQLLGMGQLVVQESQQAAQGTITSANSLMREFNQVLRLGGVLEQELEIVDGASAEIAHISRQVKHLALQASLIIGRAGGQFSAFDFITTEINKLGEQCVHANQQIVGIANRFRQRLPEVIQSAQAGEATARYLMEQMRPAELAWNQFGSLVKQLANPT